MVPRNDDAPLMLWHEAGLSADLAGRPNLLASLVSPEHVGPSVRWIRQDIEHPRMGQSTPEQCPRVPHQLPQIAHEAKAARVQVQSFTRRQATRRNFPADLPRRRKR
jgi:hypothetical protein